MKVNSQIRNIKQTLVVEINPIKYQPDEKNIIEKWSVCTHLIKDILFNGNTHFCFQELYQNINDLIMFEIPKNVIKMFDDLIMQYAMHIADNIREFISSRLNNQEFYFQFNQLWRKTLINFNLLKKVLVKFEKKYFSDLTKNVSNSFNNSNCLSITSVWMLFLKYLKLELIKQPNFVKELVDKILNNILIYRENYYRKNIKKELQEIVEGVDLLWETGLYKEYFDETFIYVSLEYYQTLSNEMILSYPVEDLISFFEKAFDLETHLITKNLNEFSIKKMISNLEIKFIIENRQKILEKLFPNEIFVSNEKIELMKRIYSLFKRVKIEDELCKSWLNYINSSGEKIYKQFNKEYTVVNFFENLNNLKKNIDLTVKESFINDEKFKSSAKEGFAKIFNLKPNAVADYLSRYIDYVLVDSDKNEKVLTEKINEFITIFKFLDAKDMFEQFHIKKLAYRLLYNLTSSMKGEKYLIEKLRSECGNVFVTKSEEMLSDLETSIELTLNYKTQSSGFETNFYVLSSYSWPVTKVITGQVSNDVLNLQINFLSYYKSKFGGKSLKLHLPLCSALLKYTYRNKTITLQVNGIQAAILMKYKNNKDIFSAKDLSRLTGIDIDDLNPDINLLTAIHHILVKERNSYKLNYDLLPIKTHLIINDVSSKEETSVDEIREVEERNWEDRKYVLDALIMKILKAKKQYKVNDVINSILAMIKFPCEISSVAMRVQSLVNGGYLCKDDSDPDLIKYNP